jgi:hypothetical protein
MSAAFAAAMPVTMMLPATAAIASLRIVAPKNRIGAPQRQNRSMLGSLV